VQLKGWYGAAEILGDPAPGSIKRSYLTDAKRFLRAVGRLLEAAGWESEGRATPGGPGVTGEASALFFRPGFEVGCYVMVCEGRGVSAKASRSGICIMYRAATRARRYGGEFGPGMQNRWDAPWDVSAGEFVPLVLAAVREAAAARGEPSASEGLAEFARRLGGARAA
jgi:hypothetical protein